MADEELGTLSFSSFVRRGLAAAVDNPDGDVANATETTIGVHVALEASDLSTDVSLPLVGPGDIVGFDRRVVARQRPRPDDNDAEYGHFALVELDQADLPWRYTPASASGDRLRPWLALVVVLEGDEGDIAAASATQKLAVLTVKDGSCLPDARQAWAWAHTQVEGTGLTPEDVASRIEGRPGLFAARIISPRILAANSRYVAALVPTFERGRLAGLGTDPGSTDAFTPAWDSGSTAPIELPVYDSWRFGTGSAGSFEQLARLILPRPISPDVGRRDMDVSAPGLELPSAAGAPMGMESALQSVEAAAAGPTAWPESERGPWIQGLKDFLNEPVMEETRVVTPPLYAQWYAAESALGQARPTGSNPPWFFELNTDPRARAAAALGTAVIQREEEALLRAGWQQVGELADINDQLRIMQLGREAWLRIYTRHVLQSSQQEIYTLTGRLHGRILCGDETICSRFTGSRIGDDLFEPQWRRWTAGWGYIGRRQGRHTDGGGTTGPDLLDKLNDGQQVAPTTGPLDGMITISGIRSGLCPVGLPKDVVLGLLDLGSQVLLFWGLLLGWVARDLLVKGKGGCWWLGIKLLRLAISLARMSFSDADARRRLTWCEGEQTITTIMEGPGNSKFIASPTIPDDIPTPVRPDSGTGVDSADATAFRQAVEVFFAETQPPPKDTFPGPMDLAACRVSLETRLDPTETVVESIQSRLVLDPSLIWNPDDPLQPIFAPPEYQQPMYRPLGEISKDWILAGLDKVPGDSAGLVMTNQRFIEAYMAGLNHEMTRELLWNELPTDQRGTYFRQFWDQAGYVPDKTSPISPDQLRDIRPIASWSKDAPLGGSSARRRLPDGTGEHLVLLVRAQLIKHYPNLIVYAVEAKPSSEGPGLTGNEAHPVFYGLLKPDVAFYGFELTRDQVVGDPGWYFILQEQPGEPRFADTTGATKIAVFPESDFAGASAVAVATYEVPFRLGIHGSTLLLPPT